MRWVILGLLIGMTSPVMAQTFDTPLSDDLIHADLPLFGYGTADMWPQHFDDADGSFGCMSRVAFGTWTLTRNDREPDEAEWYRIGNYGVFHCAALVSAADEKKSLENNRPRLAYFVLIDRRADRELWTLQLGVRPGSDYILLSRKPDAGIVKRFDVLQRDCPASLRRKGKTIDTFLTGYCAVNSRDDLIAMARSMAKRPPLGTLTWVEAEKTD